MSRLKHSGFLLLFTLTISSSGCVISSSGIKFHMVVRNLTDEEIILHVRDQDSIKHIRRITTGPAQTKLTYTKLKNLSDTLEIQKVNPKNLKIVVPPQRLAVINGILPVGNNYSPRVLRLLNSNLHVIDTFDLSYRNLNKNFFEEKGKLFKGSLRLRDVKEDDL